MKKILKITGIFIAAVFIISYVLFLAIPPFVNVDNYKSEIQALFHDSTKLNLDYSKLKFYSTPLLSVGVVAQDLSVTFDDKSSLFQASKIKGGIAIPSLLTLTVKTAKCYVDNPSINLEIKDGKQYKIVGIIEDLINENNAKPKQEEESQIPEGLIEKIRIKIPSINIKNYNISINDPKTNHSLALRGDDFGIYYNSANNTFGIKTIAELLSDNRRNILADVKFSTVLPKPQKSEEEVDPEEKIQIPFINLVEIYQKYDLKTDVFARLKIRQAKDLSYFAHGVFDVDNLNLKLSDIRLPNSFLHAEFHGKQIEYESDIYAKENEKINLKGVIKYNKHPRMKLDILSSEIRFENLLALSKALLDSLNIKNNLARIKASGYLIADAKIKTNFKKLKSEGSILVKEGSFVNPQYNIGIKDISLNAVFDNNALNLKNSTATINSSKLTLEGFIDNNSNTDIKIDVDNLSLPALYNAFAPKELKKEYNLTSANLSAHVDIKGKLEKLNAKLKTKLSDLAVSDTKKTMFITNKLADINFGANSEAVQGQFLNTGFMINLPQIKTKANINTLNLDIDSEKIVINPFDIFYNNSSKAAIKGSITNWQKDAMIDIFSSALIQTKDITTTLGKEVSYYVPSKGAIPAKVAIKGNSKKQEIIAQIYSDSQNYISPVVLDTLSGGASLIHAVVDIKGDKIKIKNSGLYKKALSGFSDDLALNISGASQIADFTTIIDGSHINLLRLSLPKDLSGKIAIFPKSRFSAKGKITLNGNFDDLSYDGDLKAVDIDIPELLLKLKTADLSMLPQGFSLNLDKIDLNGSLINAALKGDLRPSKVFRVYDIDINSDDIDVDKAMVVSDKAMKYMPPSSSSTASSSNADIPLLAEGKINIKKIKTGTIIVENIKSALGIKNNNLLLNKLTCKAFKGAISGDIKMNLISSLLTIKMKGKGLDVNDMMVNAAAMKDTLSGFGDFNCDVSLKGATYEEQMKSLKGTVGFHFKNGVYGPFSKLENFFLAENIRENPVFKNTIGVILTPILTIDSSHYEDLEGKLSFKDGVVNISPITSRGDVLCLLISGDMNLLTNNIDAKVRVRMASFISDLLGPLALANPVNLIKNTPGLNVVTAKLFSIFSAVVSEEEYKQIPDFSSKHTDANATKFQIVLKGDVAKPLKLVKSFKWLALQKDMDAAKEFSDKYIAQQEELAKQALVKKLQEEYEADNKLRVGVEKVLQMDTTAPKVKELILDEVLKTKSQEEKEALKQEAKEEIKTKVEELIQDKTKKQQEKLQNTLQKALEQKLQEKLSLPAQSSNQASQAEEAAVESAE